MRDDLPLRYVATIPSGRAETETMPLVMLMHGRGADMHDLADLAPFLDGPSGYRFVFPNAPNAWEAAPGMTFGFSWFNGLPPEPDSLENARASLSRFIDAALQRFPTPPGKVVIGGFSQGGLMALDAGLRMTPPPAGVIAMSGALFEADLPDLSSRRTLPILILHGTMDDMINVNMARRARRVLEQHGLDPEYHEFAMGHQVSQESMAVAAEFIRKSLEYRMA